MRDVSHALYVGLDSIRLQVCHIAISTAPIDVSELEPRLVFLLHDFS